MPALPASPIPLQASRALALHAQCLAEVPRGTPDADAIFDTIMALGCLQIDTLQVVARSHYLALWSRLGCYDPERLDALLFRPGERRYFEYWKKAASYIPLEHYRFSMARMKQRRERPRLGWQRWLKRDEAAPTIALVRRRIAAEGGLRASDFAYKGARRGEWWDWKPAKRALEYLNDCGELMISGRVNFQRVYDLPQRVLPPGWKPIPPAQRRPTATTSSRPCARWAYAKCRALPITPTCSASAPARPLNQCGRRACCSVLRGK